MKKLPGTILLLSLALAALTGTADAGGTYKLSAYAPPMNTSARAIATITIQAPAGNTLDAQAPPKLSMIAPDGIIVRHVRRAPNGPGKDGASSTAFEIVLAASKKGKHTLAAEVHFSLCAAQRCAPTTDKLSFDVTVE